MVEFIQSLNDIIEGILIRHEDFGDISTKKSSCQKELEKGIELIHTATIAQSQVKYRFKVSGAELKDLYTVNLSEYYCSCPSFNRSGYTCKHMFACMKHVALQNKWGDIEDAFEFIRKIRLHFTDSPEFRELIKNQKFPVTIGYSAFTFKYLNKLK